MDIMLSLEPMYKFDGLTLISEGPHYTMWISGKLLGIRVMGTITDTESALWRAALERVFRLHGMPEYVAIDGRHFDSRTSLVDRYRTVDLGRKLLPSLKQVVVLSTSPASMFVLRTIFRLLSSLNAEFLSDEETFISRVN